MPEYLEPNRNHNAFFAGPNTKNTTDYSSNGGQGDDVISSESDTIIHCPCMVLDCTRIRHFRSYSGLDEALTMNAQAYPAAAVANVGVSACNMASRLLATNPYSGMVQLHSVSSFLASTSVGTDSSSLHRALG